jgi:molecular chaperone GrpE
MTDPQKPTQTPPSTDQQPQKLHPDTLATAKSSEPGAEIGADQLRAIVSVLQKELDQVQAALEAKEAQLDASNDKFLRARADMDNMRKRVDREKEDTAKYAITKFARDVVQVADNFERAITSVPAEAKVGNPALNTLLDGVTLTEREFLNVLERHGVKRTSPLGETFNPHHHQAVMETLNPDVTLGTILQVFQAGYLIDDRVLRPAMVVVSTGGPKASRPAAAPIDPDPEPDDDELA